MALRWPLHTLQRKASSDWSSQAPHLWRHLSLVRCSALKHCRSTWGFSATPLYKGENRLPEAQHSELSEEEAETPIQACLQSLSLRRRWVHPQPPPCVFRGTLIQVCPRTNLKKCTLVFHVPVVCPEPSSVLLALSQNTVSGAKSLSLMPGARRAAPQQNSPGGHSR